MRENRSGLEQPGTPAPGHVRTAAQGALRQSVRNAETPDRLGDLANRIASATGEDEKRLFDEALALSAPSRSDDARWRRFARCGAFSELAMAIYRTHVAEGGFQFGAAPPDPAIRSSAGIATTWRAGDAHAEVHRAATPALALLRAAAVESVRRADMRRAARCSLCGGRGWFVTPANSKQMCRHERDAA